MSKTIHDHESTHSYLIIRYEDGAVMYLNYENRDCAQLVDEEVDATEFGSYEAAMDVARTYGLTCDGYDEKGNPSETLKDGFDITEADLPMFDDWLIPYKDTEAYATAQSGPVRVVRKKNIESNKAAFAQWNAITPSAHRFQNGQACPLAPGTLQAMISHLSNVKKDLRKMGCSPQTINRLNYDTIFAYDDVQEARAIIRAIFSDPMFQRNSRPVNRNYLRSGLQRWLMFLETRERC